MEELNKVTCEGLSKKFPHTILDMERALFALKDSFVKDCGRILKSTYSEDGEGFTSFMNKRFNQNSSIVAKGVLDDVGLVMCLTLTVYPEEAEENGTEK